MTSIKCPQCASEMKEVMDACTDGRCWRCRRQFQGMRHSQKLSVRHGSIFAQSHLSIREILYLLYEWSVSTSIQQSAYQLNLSERTIVSWYKTFRELAGKMINKWQPVLLGQSGDIVEIDECQIGRRKHHRGRKPNEIWIFGGILRASNPSTFFIEIVKRRDRTTLTEVIRRRINPQVRIVSDGWKAYSHLCSDGFSHSIVNHSEEFISRHDANVHTQNIENLWHCLRRFLNSKEAYKRRHIKSYIQEFIFRKLYPDHFEALLSAIADGCEHI